MKRALYYLKKALCYLTAICMSFTVFATAFFLVSSVTIGNINFTERYFTKSSMTEVMSQRLYEETDRLCEEHGIDSNVIRDALDFGYVSSAQVTALKKIYTAGSSRISSSIDTEARCLDALNKYEADGTKKLTDKEKEEITEGTMKCVDRVFSVVNIDEFGIYAKIFGGRCTILAIGFAVFSAALFGAVYLLSAWSRRSLNYIAMALVTAGELSVAMTVMFIITKPLDCLSLTNIQAYNNALDSAVGVLRLLMLAVGVLLIVAGIAVFIANYKFYSVRLRRSDTEHEIEKNLI